MLQQMGYFGSKGGSGVWQTIVAMMPPHDTYIELFAGSGVVLLNKPAAEISYAVDLDARPLEGIRKARRDVVTVCADAIAWIDGFDYGRHGRVLIYADPPYLHSTRTSRHRYRHELSDIDHTRLLLALSRVPAQVIISGYPSLLYSSVLRRWKSRQFQAMTRGGPRTEQLWFNFDPNAVHWATWAGKGFTDRQRIKRKAARWAANYSKLPPGERLAVLAAILEQSRV